MVFLLSDAKKMHIVNIYDIVPAKDESIEILDKVKKK